MKDIKVIGIDSITDYYDVNIKYERLKEIKQCLSVIVDQKSEMDENGVESGFYQGQNGSIWTFVHASIADKEAVEAVEKIFTENYIAVVVNLAAQAGVRYSITNPRMNRSNQETFRSKSLKQVVGAKLSITNLDSNKIQ